MVARIEPIGHVDLLCTSSNVKFVRWLRLLIQVDVRVRTVGEEAVEVVPCATVVVAPGQ